MLFNCNCGISSAIATWTVAAPGFRLNTRVPCTALALAVTVSVTVVGVEETAHVTAGSVHVQVVYDGALPDGTLSVDGTPCPSLWTITLPVNVVTCVARENVAVRDREPSVPVTTSGYVPPGVLVVLLNVSVVVAEPSELRETWAGENCQPTPVGMAPDAGAKLRFTDPLSAFTDCTVIG